MFGSAAGVVLFATVVLTVAGTVAVTVSPLFGTAATAVSLAGRLVAVTLAGVFGVAGAVLLTTAVVAVVGAVVVAALLSFGTEIAAVSAW